jgi:hypothetical protein
MGRHHCVHRLGLASARDYKIASVTASLHWKVKVSAECTCGTHISNHTVNPHGELPIPVIWACKLLLDTVNTVRQPIQLGLYL